MSVTINARGPAWYERTAIASRERPRLAYDLDVDVCIVGGGLAGLTAAHELARLGWSVALLEATRIGAGASGVNSGMVRPGYGCDARAIVERVGIEHAKALWSLSEAGVEYVRFMAQQMAGVDVRDGWLDVSKVDDHDELVALVALLGQEFGAEVEGWPAERVRAALATERYLHAVHFPRGFHLHALNYTLGLARAAEEAGARLFENTPAVELDPAGVRKRIRTPDGHVRAGHVVLAGNTRLAPLVPALARTILPLAMYVAVTAPLGERLADTIAYPGAVSDVRANERYRVVDGDRLMWVDGARAWPPSPRHAAERFKRSIERIYPALAPVAFEYAWSGEVGYAVHTMPQIGQLSPGLWLAGGFAAQGLNTTAMAGNLIARAIAQGDDHWRLFIPYELVWAGGWLGSAAAEAAGRWRSASERFAARQAARRARARAG